MRKNQPINVVIDFESRDPWERYEHESQQAYRAFCAFRDLGPGRRIIEAFRRYLNRPEVRCVSGYFTRWVATYKWHDRAAAYDDYLERMARLEAEKELRETAKRHVKQCRNFAVILNKIEQAVIKRFADDDAMSDVSIDVLLKSAIRGASIVPKLQEAENIALGKPNRVEVTGVDGGPVLIRYMPPVIVDDAPKPTPDEETTDAVDEVQ
jgi:hypothetical protein